MNILNLCDADPAGVGIALTEAVNEHTGHRARHLEGWANHKKVFYLRYEDLVTDPLRVLVQMRKFFGLPLEGDYRSVQELVGHWPDGELPGAWEEYFNYEDLDFFFQHVPEDFWGLS